MMFDVRKAAMRATTLAELMEGREKGDTEDLIEMGVVTIDGCESCMLPNEDGEPEEQWVYTIEEEPTKFYFAGTVLKNMFKSLLKEAAGDYEVLYTGVADQKIPVEFSKGKTREGKKCTKIRVLN